MDRDLVQHLKPAYYESVERQLKMIFYKILFKPISYIISTNNGQLKEGQKALVNAREDALREALQSGRVQYAKGIFSGEFNASIAAGLRAIGARFDKRNKVYLLDFSQVPPWVVAEALNYKHTAQGVHDSIQRRLDDIHTHLDRLVDENSVDASPTVEKVTDGWKTSARLLEVSPTISDRAKEKLAYEYSQNMDLWIKKFTEDEIQKLRDVVEENAHQGYRFDKLIEQIQYRYGVSANKAKFLARQETGLFMAKYREVRFTDAGVKRYQWSTAHDAKVRPTAKTKGVARLDNHRILDGRTFYYKDPPIVDSATGRRANPGQDYNCRCVDIPILETHRPHEEAA